MTPQTRGLGRGLEALIPSGSTPAASTGDEPAASGILTVPIADIIPNPRQPRGAMPTESLAELAASIREHGLLQPLIVTRAAPTEPAPYQLIAGERRWRAARLAGLETVAVVVRDATPQEALEMALVENIQRADLNPIEEAEAYRTLMADFHLSQVEVAERVGKNRVTVTNTLRLLQLPDAVKALLVHGAITEGHARALLALDDPDTVARAAEQVVARDLTVRQTEELARRLAAADPGNAVEPPGAPADDAETLQVRQLEEAFRHALGTKVALKRGRRGGRLVISFYSEEELLAIYDRIVGTR